MLELPHTKEIQRHVSDRISDQIWLLELLDLIRAGDSLLVFNRNFSKYDHEFSKLFLHVSMKRYKESMLDPNSLEFDLFKIISKSNSIAPILLKGSTEIHPELSPAVHSRINLYSKGTSNVI